MLTVEHLTRVYTSGERPLTVLDDVSFRLEAGTTCAIVGPSGSGKTTLLGLLAGLDRPTSGTVVLDGMALHAADEDALAGWRAESVGFVFQSFRLLPTLTARENVMVPLELLGRPGAEAREVAAGLLERVGLAERMDHYPAQLSGGEQQRVALARAFSNDPRLLFADEPTGNLDSDTAAPLVELLFELNREQGTTLVLVTHDLELAARTHRRLHLRGGRVVRDEGADPVGRDAGAASDGAAGTEGRADPADRDRADGTEDGERAEGSGGEDRGDREDRDDETAAA